MELTENQYDRIAPLLPRQRGNVGMSNLQVLNAILYVAEHGCKWRGLPSRFGNWHTVYTRTIPNGNPSDQIRKFRSATALPRNRRKHPPARGTCRRAQIPARPLAPAKPSHQEAEAGDQETQGK